MKGRLGRNPFEEPVKAAAPSAKPRAETMRETTPQTAREPVSRLENAVRFAAIDIPAYAFVAGLTGLLLTRDLIRERSRRTS